MSKNELRSGGKHRRCGFANGAGERRGKPCAKTSCAAAESIADAVLRTARLNGRNAVGIANGAAERLAFGSALAPGKIIRYNIGKQFSNRNERRTLIL